MRLTIVRPPRSRTTRRGPVGTKGVLTIQEEARTVQAVNEIATFFRAGWKTYGWPGLPPPGQQPTIEEANFFFLGCIVDYQTKVRIAWGRARRFFYTIVPAEQRQHLWQWIADHSSPKWETSREHYDLHWLKAGHDRVHRIACSIVELFDGDPRRIWAPSRTGSLLHTLDEDLGVGSAISRMIIGALRDHRLIRLHRSDFKPDIHVCRLMHVLGLSLSQDVYTVLSSAQRHFADPWSVDPCFYYLGSEYDVKTRQDFFDFYESVRSWLKAQSPLRAEMRNLAGILSRELSPAGWVLKPNGDPHWTGISLFRKGGPLANLMAQDNFWCWTGPGFENGFRVGTEVGWDSPKYEMGSNLHKALRDAHLNEIDETGYGPESHAYWKSEKLDNIESSGGLHLQKVLRSHILALQAIAIAAEKDL